MEPLLRTYAPATGANNTALGQLAYLLGNTNNPTSQNLNNTIIVFTSDHGELGGAHGLEGKGGCSYEEAIRVPFFVYIPGAGHQYRTTQMVSAVDFFGLLASIATYNTASPGNTAPWRNDNPQLASREDLFSMMINGTPNEQRLLSSTDANLSGLPYIFHTCNEFYSNKMNPMPYGATEASHVVGLRTSHEKLVYYINWYDGGGGLNIPYTTNSQAAPTNFPDTSNAEYYSFNAATGFPNDPYEITNQFDPSNSHIADLQGNMQALIKNELQAPLPYIYYGVSSPSATQTR